MGVIGDKSEESGLAKAATSTTAKDITKAATSNKAKDITNTLREQAFDSTLNMTKDLINGNDMSPSLDNVEIWNKCPRLTFISMYTIQYWNDKLGIKISILINKQYIYLKS